MPIYRFNTYGWRPTVDADGIDLADEDAAGLAGVRAFAELLRDHAAHISDKAITMVVSDGDNRPICELSFAGRKH